jgi:hypothetical protein
MLDAMPPSHKKNRTTLVRVNSKDARLDLCWWRRHIRKWNGWEFIPSEDNNPGGLFPGGLRRFEAASDASSNIGGAAVWGQDCIFWEWSEREKNRFAHINVLELLALCRAVRFYGPVFWRDSNLLFRTDPTNVEAWVNSGTARNPRAMELLRELWHICFECNIRIRCLHLPGELNILPDRASRMMWEDFEGYFIPTLNPSVANRIVRAPALEAASSVDASEGVQQVQSMGNEDDELDELVKEDEEVPTPPLPHRLRVSRVKNFPRLACEDSSIFRIPGEGRGLDWSGHRRGPSSARSARPPGARE